MGSNGGPGMTISAGVVAEGPAGSLHEMGPQGGVMPSIVGAGGVPAVTPHVGVGVGVGAGPGLAPHGGVEGMLLVHDDDTDHIDMHYAAISV